MYKPLSDSTLMSMSKKEIIAHLRIAEYNHKVCAEQIEQQYKNCIKLLEEERKEAIDDCINSIVNTPSKIGTHLKEPQRVDTCLTMLADRQAEIIDILNHLREGE